MLEPNSSNNEETGFELSSADPDQKTDSDKFEKDIVNDDPDDFKSALSSLYVPWFPSDVGTYHQTLEVRMVFGCGSVKTNRSPKPAGRCDMTKKPNEDVIQMQNNGRFGACKVCFRPAGRCFCSEAQAQSNALFRQMMWTPQPTNQDFLNTSNIWNNCGCISSGMNKFDYNPSTSPNLYQTIPFVQTIGGTNKIETVRNNRCPYCNQPPAKGKCGNKKRSTADSLRTREEPTTTSLIPKDKPTKKKCQGPCSKGQKMFDGDHEKKTDVKKSKPEEPPTSPKEQKAVVKPRKQSDESVHSKKVKKEDSVSSAEKKLSVEIKKEDSKIKSKESIREKSKDSISSKVSKDRDIVKKEESKTGEIASKKEKSDSVTSHDKMGDKKAKDQKKPSDTDVKRKGSDSKTKYPVKKKSPTSIKDGPQPAKSKSPTKIVQKDKKRMSVEKNGKKLEPIKEIEEGGAKEKPKPAKKVPSGSLRRSRSSSKQKDEVAKTPVKEKTSPETKVEDAIIKGHDEDKPPVEEEKKGDEGKVMEIPEEPPQETVSTPKLEEDIPPVEEEDKGDDGKIMEKPEEPPQETLSTPKLDEDIPPVEGETKSDEEKHEIETVLVDEGKIEEISDKLEEPPKDKVEGDRLCTCCKNKLKLKENIPPVEEPPKMEEKKLCSCCKKALSKGDTSIRKLEEGNPPVLIDGSKNEDISDKVDKMEADKLCTCCKNKRKLKEDTPPVEEQNKGDEAKNMDIAVKFQVPTKMEEKKLCSCCKKALSKGDTSIGKLDDVNPPVGGESKSDAEKHEIEGVRLDETKIEVGNLAVGVEEIPDRSQVPSKTYVGKERLCKCKKALSKGDTSVRNNPPVEGESERDEGKHGIESVRLNESKIVQVNVAVDGSKNEEISDRLQIPPKTKVEKELLCKCCKKAPSKGDTSVRNPVSNPPVEGENKSAGIESVRLDESKIEESVAVHCGKNEELEEKGLCACCPKAKMRKLDQ